MSFKDIVRSRWTKMVGVAIVLAGIAVPAIQVGAAVGNGPRDNDNNAIMYNGAYTKTEWLNKVKNGSTDASGKVVNTSANLKQIYYSENRGITEANFMSASTVDGTVTNKGEVVVNGKVVATNVWSSGRQFIPGSQKDGSVYMRPTSVSFLSPNLDAFVNMQGGTFHYAVLKACGNPVKQLNQPFGQIFKRVVNVTVDPTKDYAADDAAHAVAVSPGDKIKYLVRINNQGTGAMTNVVYTDDLPVGVALASDPTKRHIEHNLGTIASGGAVQAEINAVVTSTTDGQIITNKACFVADKSQNGCETAVIKVVKKATPTPTPSKTPTPTPIKTPTPTPIHTPTPTPTHTPIPTPTHTPTPTPTPTPTKTPTPIPTPSKTPTPTPTPTHTPSPTPTPSATPTPTPVAEFACVKLTSAQTAPLSYDFTIKPSTTNVSVTGYILTVTNKDGAKDVATSQSTTAPGVMSYIFPAAGTYTVQGQVVTSAGTTPVVAACSTSITVGQTPTPTPSNSPEVLAASATPVLPDTGAEGALAGAAGLGGLGYATSAYLRSRKSLVASLKRK